MAARIEMWRKRGGGIVLTEDLSRSQNGGGEDEGEPAAGDVRIGVCEDRDRVGGVVVVIVGCLSGADAFEDAVNIILWRTDIEELNEGDLLPDIGWEDGGMLYEAKKREKSENPGSGAGVWRAGPGD